MSKKFVLALDLNVCLVRNKHALLAQINEVPGLIDATVLERACVKYYRKRRAL